MTAMIDMERTTRKVQEALQSAQSLALRFGHAEIDGEHLLSALLEQPDGLAGSLLEKIATSLETLKSELRHELESRPRVSGPGADSGQLYASRRLGQLLLKASDEAGQLKDEYISV